MVPLVWNLFASTSAPLVAVVAGGSEVGRVKEAAALGDLYDVIHLGCLNGARWGADLACPAGSLEDGAADAPPLSRLVACVTVGSRHRLGVRAVHVFGFYFGVVLSGGELGAVNRVDDDGVVVVPADPEPGPFRLSHKIEYPVRQIGCVHCSPFREVCGVLDRSQTNQSVFNDCASNDVVVWCVRTPQGVRLGCRACVQSC